MALTLILALQAAAAAVPVPRAEPPQAGPRWHMLDFDLRDYRPSASGGCAGGAPSDVLVCGRRGGGAYPMARWARIFGPEPPIRAEMSLGGGTVARIHSQAVPLDRGAVSNRVMIGIGTRF